MMIHEVTAKVGKHKKRKRVGRGMGSGHGKTCGRGHNGAGSRSGASGSIRAGREGGQIPFFRRFAKRGFSNHLFRRDYKIVNLQAIDSRFEDGATITPETLIAAGLIHDAKTPVKVLGQGELTKKLNITAAAFSSSAQAKIEKAGGTVTVDGGYRPKVTTGKKGRAKARKAAQIEAAAAEGQASDKKATKAPAAKAPKPKDADE